MFPPADICHGIILQSGIDEGGEHEVMTAAQHPPPTPALLPAHCRHFHTMEEGSTLKRREILKYAATRKNLEDIMLSEISQSPKGREYVMPLT